MNKFNWDVNLAANLPTFILINKKLNLTYCSKIHTTIRSAALYPTQILYLFDNLLPFFWQLCDSPLKELLVIFRKKTEQALVIKI